jgi:excisionase family DNA binding protein
MEAFMDQVYTQISEVSRIEKLLKGSDIAKLLNVSRSFAYNLMQSGVIPTVHIGKSRRVRPQDLEIYIKQNIHSMGNSA